VTLMMHAFRNVPDPMMRMIQQGFFMKNLAMLGGALLIAYFGAGPASLDEGVRQPVREATAARATAAERRPPPSPSPHRREERRGHRF
jgi:hypothetical protein